VLPTQPRPAITNVGVVVKELHEEGISMIEKTSLVIFGILSVVLLILVARYSEGKGEGKGDYAGSEVCMDCHEDKYIQQYFSLNLIYRFSFIKFEIQDMVI